MHSKTITVLLAACSLGVAQLEKKQYDSVDYDSIYSSAYYAELSSLGVDPDSLSTNLDSLDDLATSYNVPGPTATSNDLASATASPDDYDDYDDDDSFGIPSSIESVLATAVPSSFLSQMADPTAYSSIVSEIEDGHFPDWYNDLPTSVKSWFETAYGGSDASSSDGPTSPGAASNVVVASGLLGAAGILAAAVLL